MILKRLVRMKPFERGLVFVKGECKRLLGPGWHWIDLNQKLIRVSTRSVRFEHADIEVVIKSGVLKDEAEVLDLRDGESALVWVDGRFYAILGAGQHVLWTSFHEVKVKTVDIGTARFEHDELAAILQSDSAEAHLQVHDVRIGHEGLFFCDGVHIGSFSTGRYAFWKSAGALTAVMVDTRECVLDVTGQEIMTSDKVTLRLNSLVTYRVTNALASITGVEDRFQALYREVQLALRGAIAMRDLDQLLSDKESIAAEPESILRKTAARFGIEVIKLGIKDIILPGEMKDLLNKVTEAKKASEANAVARREETAAMRSQANTARILESSPTLMKLRELEVLEKIAGNSKLSVVLGEKGLADRVINLL